ncbi:MAG: hypothetical protein Q9171_006775 [Xanthocarpia ochracea]
MHAKTILALTGITVLSTLSSAVTPPPTCQYKVFIDAYPNVGCVVLDNGVTGAVGVSLVSGLFVAPNECKDSPQRVQSFRNAISNDAKAKTCTLKAYDGAGCMGTAFALQPNTEADEDECIDYPLRSGTLLGAKSFKLEC